MSRFAQLNKPAEGRRFDKLSDALRPGANLDMSKRDPAFRMPTTSTNAAAKPAAKVAASPPKYSPSLPLVDLVAQAKSEARWRCKAVQQSSEYIGREKQAAELLMASCSHNSKFGSSTAIIEELRKRPLDSAIPAQRSKTYAKTRAECDAVWAKAQATLDAQRGTPREPNATVVNASEPATDSVWDRAWANIAAQRGLHLHDSEQAQPTTKAQRAATGKHEKRTPEEVWERADKAPKHLPGF